MVGADSVRNLILTGALFDFSSIAEGCSRGAGKTLPSTTAVIHDASVLDAASSSNTYDRAEKPRAELPRGGRELFPRYRLVGFCGTPGAPKLGPLLGNLAARAKTIETYAHQYESGREALPTFELIAVVAQQAPGHGGKYRVRVADGIIDRYLAAAREAKALLLLNIQPGRSDFLTEAKHFERYLREPEVGLALDPEWTMSDRQTPGATFGQVHGAAIDEVALYLSKIVTDFDLPEKVLVFHQVNGHVVRDEAALAARTGVVLIKSVDGLGSRPTKVRT